MGREKEEGELGIYIYKTVSQKIIIFKKHKETKKRKRLYLKPQGCRGLRDTLQMHRMQDACKLCKKHAGVKGHMQGMRDTCREVPAMPQMGQNEQVHARDIGIYSLGRDPAKTPRWGREESAPKEPASTSQRNTKEETTATSHFLQADLTARVLG